MVGLGTTDATYLTGECNTTAKPPVCLAVAWCPPEEPSSAIAKDMHVLEDVANFTVFFRVDGRFEGIDEFESSQITTLAFNENTFFLRDILTYSQSSTQMRRTVTPNVTVALDDATNITAFDTVKETGTVVFLTATMMKRESDITDPKPCEFSPGANITELCKIYLQFNRVDPKGKSLSKGANYRFTTPAGVVTTGERDLTKLFGTRIVFTVGGTGAQFDLITLTVRLPSFDHDAFIQPLFSILCFRRACAGVSRVWYRNPFGCQSGLRFNLAIPMWSIPSQVQNVEI